MYYLAIDRGVYEGWKLEEYKTLEEVKQAIESGNTYTQKYKVLKQLDVVLSIIDNDE